MSRIYTENDYAPQGQHVGSRNTYSDDDYEVAVVTWIDQRLAGIIPGIQAFQNNKLLIAGCGLGFILQRLMDVHGFTDVWGCDASSYAVNRAKVLWPHLANRFVQTDVTVRSQVNSLRAVAGLTGNQQFRLVVTEDLLPCASSVAEAQTMLTELRRVAQGEGHVISMRFPDGTLQPDGSVITPWGGTQMPGYLWFLPSEWRTIVGNNSAIFTAIGQQVP